MSFQAGAGLRYSFYPGCTGRQHRINMDLLRAYLDGNHVVVWSRLRELGDTVLQEPAWTEASAVAAETMKRARENVERLVLRLDELGYRFFAPREVGLPWRSPLGLQISTDEFLVHRPPQPRDVATLDAIEGTLGRLPLALRAWYQIVGSVSFLGDHPKLNTWDTWATEGDGVRTPLYGDPLEISPLETLLGPNALLNLDDVSGFAGISIAPDAKHKANVSGGHEYTIPLKPWSADPPVLYEPHGVSFVEYLRIAFQYGGFPGWDRMPRRPDKELEYLTEGLLPI